MRIPGTQFNAIRINSTQPFSLFLLTEIAGIQMNHYTGTWESWNQETPNSLILFITFVKYNYFYIIY